MSRYHQPLPEVVNVRTTAKLNLRQGPGMRYHMISTLNQDTHLRVKALCSDWAEVEHEDRCGFVHRYYIEPLTDTEPKPSFCYPLPLLDIRCIHSALIYNLDSFRGRRDGFGRADDGAWGRYQDRDFYGKDVWSGTVIPRMAYHYLEGGWHGATDISTWRYRCSQVHSVCDGIVVRIQVTPAPQHSAVMLRHELNNKYFYTIYQHLSRRGLPQAGERIDAGKQIGKLASMGAQTHLHFELHSPYRLWDYRYIGEEDGNGYSIDYAPMIRIRSQFGRSFLPDDLLPHHYCYNGLAIIKHLRMVFRK